MLKGIKIIREKGEEARQLAQSNRIRRLFLKDGESVVFRFLTDSEEIIEAIFHDIKEVSSNGNEFWRTKYCTLNDLKVCVTCDLPNKPSKKICSWIYTYYIFHKQQNPRLDSDPEAQRWERLSVSGGQIVYKELINAPMLLMMGPGARGANRNLLIAQSDEHGTLLDRDYRYSRTGTSKDTVYTLTPKDPSNMAPEVRAVIGTLPNLETVLMALGESGKVESTEQPKVIQTQQKQQEQEQVKKQESLF